MQTALILVAAYIMVMPIIFRLLGFAHRRMVTDRKTEKMRRGPGKVATSDLPKPIWPIWKERIAYTLKDKRTISLGKKKDGRTKPGAEPAGGLQNRVAFLLIWALGLILVAIGAFTQQWLYLVLPGFLIFFFAMGFAIGASKDILEARKKMYQRMFNLAQSKLGIPAKYADTPQAVVQVLEWADPLKPTKVCFHNIPESFAMEGEEGFLKQFNQVFGQENAWVPFENQETGDTGWNYDAGTVTLFSVPPLPTMAKWDSRYVLDPNVAWSYFPIALSVNNGLSLTNPDTGEVENVLGFDLSGEQVKLSAKTGTPLGPEVTTSPMVFVGGGTGGGKSWDSDELIEVLGHVNEG